MSLEFLRRFNSTTEWSASFGLEPAEFLSRGLPVLPRFRLSESGTGTPILAALAGQAIIPSGHHQDLADELRLVEKASETINRLGEVKWCNLAEIARTNYKHRVSGGTLQIKMYSRRIRANVPAEVDSVQVYRAWKEEGDSSVSLEQRLDGEPWIRCDGDEILLPQQNGRARTLELRSVVQASVPPNIPALSMHPWGIVRRLLTEARDRCHFWANPQNISSRSLPAKTRLKSHPGDFGS